MTSPVAMLAQNPQTKSLYKVMAARQADAVASNKKADTANHITNGSKVPIPVSGGGR